MTIYSSTERCSCWTFVQVVGASCSGFMMSCLKLMAELRDSYKFSNVNELEFAVGTAIRVMGPETVLNAIPLQV
jgi:hypothetical protein